MEIRDLVLTEIEGDIATVTLNRPDKLNALSQALWARVGEVVADLSADETLRYAAARRIADGAPLSNRWHKKFARRLLDPRPLTPRRPLTPEEFDEGFASAATSDYQEGYQAFMEKRKPKFGGEYPMDG